MNRLVDYLCALFRFTGVPLLIREALARNRVTILNYHNPDPIKFEEHISFFARNYSFISADMLSDALRLGSFHCLPPKAMLITLDDAHAGNYALVGTIKKFKVPVLIYAVAGAIGTSRHFWFKNEQIESSVLNRLKMLSDGSRRATLARDYGFVDDQEYPNRHALSIDELTELIAAGACIGSHTMTHPLLTRCSNVVVDDELGAAKRQLEAITGHNVAHFAYPCGDWNASVREAVAAAGYLTARTIEPGFVSAKSDPLALRNFGVADNASLSKAVLQACGLWSYVKCRFLGGAP